MTQQKSTTRVRLIGLGTLVASMLAVSFGAFVAPVADGQTPPEASVATRAIHEDAVPSDAGDSEATVDPSPMQGSCGDGRCSPPEDCHSCPSDCGSCCGNNRCEPPEDCRSCPRDCGGCCGDGRCEPPEDNRSCPRDC